ncbi:hypothetical protein L210DRAFT_3646738 [Boletus edulis BED1]|uniref:Uncharacterized protein n=1 Tax=Boletus edulis BED1 TaxID=1328754 RepID=A0AAD4BST7_BOLED|nr:hypothetical protein L210DRAFT_3646738 [Boletus edulis BED1]
MQNAISRLLATTYFTVLEADRQLLPNFEASLLGSNTGFQKPHSEVPVMMSILQVELNINLPVRIPIHIFATHPQSHPHSRGYLLRSPFFLITKLCFDILTPPIVSPPCYVGACQSRTTLVLDVLRFSSRLPALRERVAGVVTQEAEKLRSTGTFRVCLAVGQWMVKVKTPARMRRWT